MDIIKRAILFGGKAIVSVIDSTHILKEASEVHEFAAPTARAMGKLLTVAAFMSGNFKNQGNRLTLIVSGDGPIGRMMACGEYGGKVRAKCENPKAGIVVPNATVSDVVGKNGTIEVIKDFGLKVPYNGLCELVNGSIDFDFAYYFTGSEQLATAISCGSVIENDKVVKNGGIIVQPMPNCEDHLITILEDIVNNFKDFGQVMLEKTPEEILEFYFGHFEIQILDDIFPKYECSCSKKRIIDAVKLLGKDDAVALCQERGAIEVSCDFCGKKYTLNKEEVDKIFK